MPRCTLTGGRAGSAWVPERGRARPAVRRGCRIRWVCRSAPHRSAAILPRPRPDVLARLRRPAARFTAHADERKLQVRIYAGLYAAAMATVVNSVLWFVSRARPRPLTAQRRRMEVREPVPLAARPSTTGVSISEPQQPTARRRRHLAPPKTLRDPGGGAGSESHRGTESRASPGRCGR